MSNPVVFGHHQAMVHAARSLTCWLALAMLAASSAAAAPPPPSQVVGGQDAELGKWPDAVAVYVGMVPLCTGVLVAPTVVLTAAHCNTSGLMEVLIGADTLAADNQGERIAVARRIEHPRWEDTFDVLVLVLARPSTRPPRPLASGWAAAELVDGTAVSVVGYGAVNMQGNQYVERLQEGRTAITDATCARSKGCNPEAVPAGELGAGGMGVDSCLGDSGGPLYADTSFGTVVAGLTSRSYDDATVPCSQGGIYVRAGRIVHWIERETGVALSRGPDPTFEPLTTSVGQGAQTRITANDPYGRRHSFELGAPTALGDAAVYSDGSVRLCGKNAGRDQLVVIVTDRADPSRRAYVTIPVDVEAGEDRGDCSLELDDGGCGCQSSGPGQGLPLLLLALGLRRRRRQSRERSVPSPPRPRDTCHYPGS